MGVSLNGGIYTPTTPQNDHFFGKPMVVWYHHFKKETPKMVGESVNPSSWWVFQFLQPQVCAAYCHGKFLDSAHVAELVAAARFSLSEAGFRGGARSLVGG